ncbi:hypothetical protein OC846_005613 [Tilletia horrida]|uniref:DUF1772-domain-containing protein n=1 Tax=Tilletia horrida TaxID=155126 RepID=A0AAN6JVT7_9BASI|nr:hypothetical protein OC846_005613 [Tilletia horrida]KAK0561551.1 hypothetical protein OC861_005761 [Tilletia horrida]
MAQWHDTPFAVATGLGLAASAYMFLGNLGMDRCGVIRATTSEQLREELDLNADRSVALFGFMYEKGAQQFVSSTAISAVSWLYASYVSTKSSRFASVEHQNLVTRLLFSASLFSFSFVPFTVVVMLPNIKPLLSMRSRVQARNLKASSTNNTPTLQGEEADQALRGIELWKKHNYMRMCISFSSFILGTLAVTLA